MLDPEVKSLLSEFDKFSFRPPAWTYAHATYPLKKKGYIFASDGHDPFIYDPDQGRSGQLRAGKKTLAALTFPKLAQLRTGQVRAARAGISKNFSHP